MNNPNKQPSTAETPTETGPSLVSEGEYDESGYDEDGYDEYGYDENGLDSDGADQNGNDPDFDWDDYEDNLAALQELNKEALLYPEDSTDDDSYYDE